MEEMSFWESLPRTSLAASDEVEFWQADQREAWESVDPERTSEWAAGSHAAPGNTAPQTSILSSIPPASGGVDWLEATIYGSFDEERYRKFMQQAEAAAAVAKVGGAGRSVDVMGARLIFRATGFRWGNTFYQYAAEADGIRFAFGRPGQAASCSVAKVQVGSIKLMRDGAERCWAEALAILREVGIFYDRSVLFRIDVCVDLPGVPVGPFCDAMFNREVITRIKSGAHFYRAVDGEWSGLSVGSRSGVSLNIYDKSRELREKSGDHSDVKRALLIENRWGVDCDEASRVEFQVRGEWIRTRFSARDAGEWGGGQVLSSVEDVLEALPGLTGYLVTGFFRLVDGPPDRENNNQSKASVSPLWNQVIESFVSWVGRAAEELPRAAKLRPNQDRIVRRFVSSAVAVAAMCPRHVGNRQSAIQCVVDALVRYLPDEKQLYDSLVKRWEAWEAAGVYDAFDWNAVPQGNWSRTLYERHDGELSEAMVLEPVAFDVE